MAEKTYIAIDLKSFFASVECVERSLDPLTTNLVVADITRTEKTICLAVTPSLKAYGIPGRARLFEVVQKVKQVNAQRLQKLPGGVFAGASTDDIALKRDASLSLDYIVAKPRMATYMSYSTRIFQIYLRYVAPQDIHIYSVDEVFIDATGYLDTYHLSARDFAMKMILDVLQETGITATAGIGPNLFLCKVAMDIEAKHIASDKNGVRIAQLNELSYREKYWDHRPLTDFWRVGKGYAKKLQSHGIYTMGDIARCSIGTSPYFNEDILYNLFGVSAELLIDHAWGYEPTTIADIKAYTPSSSSTGAGQVLSDPYTFDKARIVAREMADSLSLDLLYKGLVTDQLVLTVGYDISCLSDGILAKAYTGPVTADFYGRKVPKPAHGTENIPQPTASTSQIIEAAMRLFDRIVDSTLLVRRMYLVAGRVFPEDSVPQEEAPTQLDLFGDHLAQEQQKQDLEREKKLQNAVLSIKLKYGKNAILKGMNFEEGATAMERNKQIGGHKA